MTVAFRSEFPLCKAISPKHAPALSLVMKTCSIALRSASRFASRSASRRRSVLTLRRRPLASTPPMDGSSSASRSGVTKARLLRASGVRS